MVKMAKNSKILAVCYLISGVFLGWISAGAIASISTEYGGSFEATFWEFFPVCLILGCIVAICPMLWAGSARN